MDEFTDLDGGSLIPALVATGVWLGVGAALDVYLVTTNKSRYITHVLRTKPGKVFLALLCLHVVDILGKADPFRAAQYVIQAKRVVVVPELADTLPVSK